MAEMMRVKIVTMGYMGLASNEVSILLQSILPQSAGTTAKIKYKSGTEIVSIAITAFLFSLSETKNNKRSEEII